MGCFTRCFLTLYVNLVVCEGRVGKIILLFKGEMGPILEARGENAVKRLIRVPAENDPREYHSFLGADSKIEYRKRVMSSSKFQEITLSKK